jgi:hypothetical protein
MKSGNSKFSNFFAPTNCHKSLVLKLNARGSCVALRGVKNIIRGRTKMADL